MRLLTLALCGTAIFASCEKNNNEGIAGSSKVAGYLYTTTNGESTNQAVRFSRLADGSLTDKTILMEHF